MSWQSLGGQDWGRWDGEVDESLPLHLCADVRSKHNIDT